MADLQYLASISRINYIQAEACAAAHIHKNRNIPACEKSWWHWYQGPSVVRSYDENLHPRVSIHKFCMYFVCACVKYNISCECVSNNLIPALLLQPRRSEWCRAGLLEAYVTQSFKLCPLFFLSAGASHAAWPGLLLPSPEATDRLILPSFPLSFQASFLPSFSPFSRPSLWRGCGPTRSWWTCCHMPGWSRGRGATGGTGGEGKGRVRWEDFLKCNQIY